MKTFSLCAPSSGLRGLIAGYESWCYTDVKQGKGGFEAATILDSAIMHLPTMLSNFGTSSEALYMASAFYTRLLTGNMLLPNS